MTSILVNSLQLGCLLTLKSAQHGKPTDLLVQLVCVQHPLFEETPPVLGVRLVHGGSDLDEDRWVPIEALNDVDAG